MTDLETLVRRAMTKNGQTTTREERMDLCRRVARGLVTLNEVERLYGRDVAGVFESLEIGVRVNYPHCGHCGKENPAHVQGYTLCCNEVLCRGTHKVTYVSADREEEVEACCEARATDQWLKKYGHTPPLGTTRTV